MNKPLTFSLISFIAATVSVNANAATYPTDPDGYKNRDNILNNGFLPAFSSNVSEVKKYFKSTCNKPSSKSVGHDYEVFTSKNCLGLGEETANFRFYVDRKTNPKIQKLYQIGIAFNNEQKARSFIKNVLEIEQFKKRYSIKNTLNGNFSEEIYSPYKILGYWKTKDLYTVSLIPTADITHWMRQNLQVQKTKMKPAQIGSLVLGQTKESTIKKWNSNKCRFSGSQKEGTNTTYIFVGECANFPYPAMWRLNVANGFVTLAKVNVFTKNKKEKNKWMNNLKGKLGKIYGSPRTFSQGTNVGYSFSKLNYSDDPVLSVVLGENLQNNFEFWITGYSQYLNIDYLDQKFKKNRKSAK